MIIPPGVTPTACRTILSALSLGFAGDATVAVDLGEDDSSQDRDRDDELERQWPGAQVEGGKREEVVQQLLRQHYERHPAHRAGHKARVRKNVQEEDETCRPQEADCGNQ